VLVNRVQRGMFGPWRGDMHEVGWNRILRNFIFLLLVKLKVSDKITRTCSTHWREKSRVLVFCSTDPMGRDYYVDPGTSCYIQAISYCLNKEIRLIIIGWTCSLDG
jgi:hypothetical protein